VTVLHRVASIFGLGDEALAIYLNDHLAGATLGASLARRAAGNNRSGPYGETLDAIAGEIEEDRDALLDVMARLSVREDALKVALGWGAEKASRFKPNGALGYSTLARLEELEALVLGVTGKLGLWQALQRTHGDDVRLQGLDLEALAARARSQRRRLERLRARAAGEALV
jgi:hypothetical protein